MFFLIRKLRACLGYDKYSAETFDRLTQSVHVKDLRWVAGVSAFVAFLALFAVIIMALATHKDSVSLRLYGALVPLGATLAAVGGVFAWCYKTGSSRLGIIDLFACEITTLCRICTINGLADTCIAAFKFTAGEADALRERFTHFDSSEAYTPIFDGNAKELHSLGVKVVVNITAFYTYWKATRDAFRKLASTPLPTAASSSDAKIDAWQRAMRQVMYMQFLTLESARKAVRDLIEFEPNNAENTITILLSELPAYRFLLDNFPQDDVRHSRLELRRARYRAVVPEVYYFAEDEYERLKQTKTRRWFASRQNLAELCRDWDKAYRMLKELKKRYEDAIGDFPARENVVVSREVPGVDSVPHKGLNAVPLQGQIAWRRARGSTRPGRHRTVPS